MDKRPVERPAAGRPARRLVDGFVALLTWVVAAGAVMWFYDWVSRWYVVVAVLLVIVAGAALGDRLKAERAGSSATSSAMSSAEVTELLPVPREPAEPTTLAS
jgi:hypothetical protein